MRKFKMILYLIALSAMAGCIRRPFGEDRTAINLMLQINMEIKHEIQGVQKPEKIRVILCDHETGEVKYEDFLGPDGGYIYPQPGNYDILVYNFYTESTIIRNENNLYTAYATTNPIPDFVKAQLRPLMAARRQAIEKAQSKSESPPSTKEDTKTDEERIMNEPDHLFVGRKDKVTIPKLEVGESKNIVIEMKAETIVEKWEVVLNNVKGLEYIRSTKALMTGLVESTLLYNKEDSEDPIIIYFEMYVDKKRNVLAGSFRTFGKNPLSDNKLHIDLGITDTGGNEHFVDFDVTEQFNENEEHLIIVEKEVIIEKPKGGGGFAPEVEDWEDVHQDIVI